MEKVIMKDVFGNSYFELEVSVLKKLGFNENG